MLRLFNTITFGGTGHVTSPLPTKMELAESTKKDCNESTLKVLQQPSQEDGTSSMLECIPIVNYEKVCLVCMYLKEREVLKSFNK